MGYFKTAKFGDCEKLAPIIRETDKQEVWASHGLEPLQALKMAFVSSEEVNSIVDDKEDIIGMFGVARQGDIGSPWLILSDGIYEKPAYTRQFFKGSIEWVKRIQENYPLLTNYVAEDNEAAIKWLKLLGFKFISYHPNYGVNPKPFYNFVRIRSK